MKAMILAAGYGTRLRPLTYTVPKPMVPLCNRPLVAWAVESFLRAGINDLIVNLHHLPEAIEKYLRERYGSDTTFHFSYEEEILGTGGGVRRVRPQLEGEQDFFLVNGDTVQFPNYDALIEARRSMDALAALTLREPPENDRFTPVWLENDRVTGFGKGSGRAYVFAGSHLISSRIFRYLPDKEFSGIVDEGYQPLLDSGRETLTAIIDKGLWYDVGTPQRYLSANAALLDATVRGDVTPTRGSAVRGDSVVHETAKARAGLVRSCVGARSVVTGELRDSIVWDDCVITGNTILENCIVATGVELTRPMELRNAIICRDDAAIPDDPAYEKRDGVVIVRI